MAFALSSAHGGSAVLFAVASLTALLTAFYMFRLLWLTFFGAPRMSKETAHHVHESPASMTGVLVLLAVGSAVGGFVSIPHYLEPMFALPPVKEGLDSLEKPVVYLSVAIALIGLAGAWHVFGDLRRAESIRTRFAAIYSVLAAKYYVDELYDTLLARPLTWISKHVFLDFGDRALLDGTLDGMARLARRTAGVLARVQTGQLQLYLLLALAGIVGALWWMSHV